MATSSGILLFMMPSMFLELTASKTAREPNFWQHFSVISTHFPF
jgi:hypothetical protein